jgi:tetratricopeptide (TPR) repeat protein
MSGDLPWMRALEGTCLAKLGRTTEAHAILDELEHRRDTDYADALYMAILRYALDEQAEAFKEIERAVDENSAFLYSIDVDPKMDVFRSDPRYTRIRDAMKI